MTEFLSLEGAARVDDAMMALVTQAQAKLPLAIRPVRHEELVADLDGEMQAILGFLGLGWDDAVHGVAGRAAARAVTPCDLQLRRGLSAEGIGQWRRHEAGLAPVLPLLDPWVRRFGYG